MKLTLGQIADYIHAEGDFNEDAEAFGYSIDSRTLNAGDLFFAVKGDRVDGHDYVEAALANGAAGCVVSNHWLALDELRTLGAEAVDERVVFDGKLVTAAGVSAGIDMALALAARIAGDTVAQAIQLGIEYDPQPPFDAGSPSKAPAEIVELLRNRSRFLARAG